MASLVSMTSRSMMVKLHRNTEVKKAQEAFASMNTLLLLRKSEVHCNLVWTSTTVEKTKLFLKARHEHAPARILEKVQLGEGGGGGNGSNIRKAGGKGNGVDNDDYFHHIRDDDNGAQDGRLKRRDPVPENFNPNLMQAILQEWGTTIRSLPGEVRQAVEMKVINSSQMARFLSENAQPTMTRIFSRMSPKSVSRVFMGRILANHGFRHKLLFDEMVTIACVLRRELKHRRDMRKEWDVVAMIVLTSVVSTAYTNWALAPCRSYNSIFMYGFRNALQNLPNHEFDTESFSLREFDMAKTVLSFVCKVGELSLFGFVMGALASVLPLTKGKNVAAPLFSMSRRAWGCGAFLGLTGTLRCLVISGLERLMQDHLEHLGAALFLSALLRAFNVQIGDANCHSKINSRRH